MNIASEQEMLAFGKQFAKNPPRVIELIGDVGAGKTTFVRGLAQGLGVKGPVTSPSFTISKSYALPSGGNLIHYDFYRLSDPGLMSEDLKEKIANDSIIIIEWSNSVKDILPKNRTIIKINCCDDGSREVEYNCKDAFRDHTRLTRSGTSAVSPVTTGANERVEKDTLQLYLDTSAPTTILKLNNKEYQWHSDRNLAEKLLKFIHDKLRENDRDFYDLTKITFMSGPGSFTGLRIGAAVVNTLAHDLDIPLYTHQGKKVKIILPDYGRDANISNPRK